MATYNFSVSDAFPFIDIVAIPQKYAVITDTLILNDSAVNNVKINKINQQLFLNQSVTFGFSLLNVTFNDTLIFKEVFGPTKEYRIEDVLEITSVGERFGYSESVEDFLEFSESIIASDTIRNLHFSDTLNFVDRVFHNLFRGSSPIPVDIDVTTIDSEINNAPAISCYPTEVSGLVLVGYGSVVLPRPTFGNKDTFNVARVNIRSRGNELIVFSTDYWSKDKVIDYEFTIYDYLTVYNLQQFISGNLGKMITLYDHEGNTFTGIILTGSLVVKQHNICEYTTSFSFQKFVS